MSIWLDGQTTGTGNKAECFDGVTVSCPPEFQFRAATIRAPNQVSLLVSNAPYANVTIHQSSDLVNWAVLTNLVATNGTVRFTDTSASNAAQRFYNATSP